MNFFVHRITVKNDADHLSASIKMTLIALLCIARATLVSANSRVYDADLGKKQLVKPYRADCVPVL